ncbi:Fasciclin-like arabinogalactan protein 2 [Linum grandiflorum]
MSKQPPRPSAAIALSLLLTTTLLISTTTVVSGHNITRILAKHPQFSTFNHYLTVTHLAAEINRRQTITVLALDNDAMSSLVDKHLSESTLRNVLSLHVLVDYYGTKKLHQITGGSTLTSTMFQATGAAPGTSGFLNITDLKGGKAVNSVEAEAPASAPSLNLTAILRKQGCTKFSDLLTSTGAAATFEASVDGGLTVFCPSDAVITSFAPKYKNLTDSQKLSLVLYHGIPVFMPMQMMKSNNGVVNTLATDGASKYDITVQDDGEIVKLKTKVVTATIKGTLKEQDPLIVYKVDKVLQPKELFKAGVDSDDVAPAPAPKGAAKKKGKKGKSVAADGPDAAESPEGDSDDSTAADEDTNGAVGINGGRSMALFMGLSLCMGMVLLL